MEEITFFNGNWKAVEKIGEGTFGTVYKAEKVENYGVKNYSAIKQIMIPHSEKEYLLQKSEGMTQSDIEKSYDNQVKKWISEIEFLSQFKDNVNIVSIEDYEVIERKDKPGRIINIKMELLQSIEGNELDKIFTDKKVLKMALDILNALEECEENNVVHRDIKPDNVFVNSRGVFKLGDFGEAKSIEKTVSNMSKKGTENYMAPEIYKGERGSKTVDTYSLGIMLYKYFNNNRIPFLPDYPTTITYEDRENALYKRMFGEEMKAPVKASSNIAKIILKACSYDPKDRYKSASDLKRDIKKEYEAIKRSKKLFDFQQEETKQEEMESSCENISSKKEVLEKEELEKSLSESSNEKVNPKISVNLNSKSNYDETVSIFSDFLPKDDENKKACSSKSSKVDDDIKVKVDEKKEEKINEHLEYKKSYLYGYQAELERLKRNRDIYKEELSAYDKFKEEEKRTYEKKESVQYSKNNLKEESDVKIIKLITKILKIIKRIWKGWLILLLIVLIIFMIGTIECFCREGFYDGLLYMLTDQDLIMTLLISIISVIIYAVLALLTKVFDQYKAGGLFAIKVFFLVLLLLVLLFLFLFMATATPSNF